MKQFLTGFLSSVLLCVLLTPSVHAQTPPPPAPGAFEPPNSCSPSANRGTTDVPEPFCPLGGVSDTVPFVVPPGFGDWQFSQCAVNGSAFGEGFSWVNNVCNRTYRFNGLGIQKSNDKHLTYRIDGDAIRFLEDTTWANGDGIVCEDLGDRPKAFQRISAVRHTLRSLSCGQDTTDSGTNTAYKYEPTIHEPTPMNPSAQACQNRFAGNIGTGNKMVYHGLGKCNDFNKGSPGEIMVLVALPGTAGAGEVFVYCKDAGLCAWYQKIDWTTTSPSEWTASTDFCAGLGQSYGACYVEDYTANERMQLTLTQQIAVAINDILNISIPIGEFIPPAEFASDDLTPWAAWYRVTYLLTQPNLMIPRIISDKTTHESSIRSTICYTDPATGEGKALESKEPIRTSGHPWVAKYVDGVEVLTAFVANTPLTGGPYYNLGRPNEVLGISPPCDANSIGAQPPDLELAARGVNTYVGSGGAGSPSVLQIIGLTVLENIFRIFFPGGNVFSMNAELVPAQHLSASGEMGKFTKELFDSRVSAAINRPAIVPNGKQENCFIKPDGTEECADTRNETTYEDYVLSRCLEQVTLPAGVQKNRGIFGDAYCPIWKEAGIEAQRRAASENNTNDTTPGGSLGGAIDIAGACSVDQGTITSLLDDVQRGFTAWGAQGATNLNGMWSYVTSLAGSMQINGEPVAMNPALALAMWIEETAASGVNSSDSWAFGCRGDRNADYAPSHPNITLSPGQQNQSSIVQQHLEDQMDCIKRFVIRLYNSGGDDTTKAANYVKFLCHWRYGNPNCNPSSVAGLGNRLMHWYELLSPSCGIVNTSTSPTPSAL